jgi:hypothetical protein
MSDWDAVKGALIAGLVFGGGFFMMGSNGPEGLAGGFKLGLGAGLVMALIALFFFSLPGGEN